MVTTITIKMENDPNRLSQATRCLTCKDSNLESDVDRTTMSYRSVCARCFNYISRNFAYSCRRGMECYTCNDPILCVNAWFNGEWHLRLMNCGMRQEMRETRSRAKRKAKYDELRRRRGQEYMCLSISDV